MVANPGSRWDGDRAGSYDDKWQRMAAQGQNPHGEVDFVQRFGPSSVLDAGCGTGRVAIELARRGIESVGTDLDPKMLSEARNKAPELEWVQSDLATLNLGRAFDVVVMAGNIVLFVEPGTEADVVAGAARHVADGGRLVAGFSLGHGVTPHDWEQWLGEAGLVTEARCATWDATPWSDTDTYLVSVATRQPTL